MCRTEYVNGIQVVSGIPIDPSKQLFVQLDFGFQPLEGIERDVASVLLDEEGILYLIEQLQSTLDKRAARADSEDAAAECAIPSEKPA